MVKKKDLFILSPELENIVAIKTLSESALFSFVNLPPIYAKTTVHPLFSRLSSIFASIIDGRSSFSPIHEDKSKHRILCIDDEPNITKVLKIGLEKSGYIVDAYNHPKEALSSFRKNAYDLLLIDIRLPEINGIDLCNELLKIDRNVKVCFMTAYELQKAEVKKRVPALETECIINKPVSFNILISKINGQLNEDN